MPERSIALDIEGFPLRVVSYPLCGGYLTEIELAESGSLVARGGGLTLTESRTSALGFATARLQRVIGLERMIGG